MYKDLANYDLNLNEKTPDWFARLFKMLIKDAIIFIAALILIEALLRAFVPSTADLVFTKDITGGHVITKNSFDLRDDEFPLAKPAGEKRILVLGNSTSFGTGAGNDDTYPQQLEVLYGSKGVQVINGGGQGGSIDSLIAFYKEQGRAFSPDLVVLGFSPSMIAKTKKAGAKAANKKRSLKAKAMGTLKEVQGALFHSYAYVSFDFYVRKNMYSLGIIEDDLTDPNGASYAYAFDTQGIKVDAIEEDYSLFFEQLKELKSVLDEDGIPFVILGIPSQFEVEEGASANPRRYPLDKIRISPLDKIGGYAAELNVPYVDTRRALRGHEDTLYIRTDTTHLTRDGLGIVAQELYNSIEQGNGL